jgi:hypothetical protein
MGDQGRFASIIATTIFTLAISSVASAQDSPAQKRSTKHHHYVVDMGSPGGPDSILWGPAH